LKSSASDFVKRLEEVSSNFASRAAFAKAAGLSAAALQHYLAGSEPTRPALISLASAAGVSVTWLATGRGPKTGSDGDLPPDLMVVPFFDLRRNIYPLMTVPPSDVAVIRRSYLQNPVGDLIAVPAMNDLSPYISGGDLLVVDRKMERTFKDGRLLSPWPQAIEEGGSYLVAVKERALVRQLGWHPVRRGDPPLIVQAPGTKAETVDAQAEDFQIIGHVVWRAGRVLP
jgi:hypothetical protein